SGGWTGHREASQRTHHHADDSEDRPSCAGTCNPCLRAYSITSTSTIEATERCSRSAAARNSCLTFGDVRMESVSTFKRVIARPLDKSYLLANVLHFACHEKYMC